MLHRDLEIWVKGHSRSLATEPLDKSYTTLESKGLSFNCMMLNIIVTLKCGLKVTQGH